MRKTGAEGQTFRASFFCISPHNYCTSFCAQPRRLCISSFSTVVGFSSKTAGDSTRDDTTRLYVAPFRNADGSETQLKMRDVKVNQEYDESQGCCTGFQPGSDTIQMFSVSGQSTNEISYVTKDALENLYYNYDAEAGWYNAQKITGWTFDEPLDDTAVRFGEGFLVKVGLGAGVLPQITFAGEVKQTPTEIPGVFFTISGNSTPVDICVSNILVNQEYDYSQGCCTGFQPGSDSIQIFDAAGQPKYDLSYVTKDALENLYYNYTDEPGWYATTKVTSWEFDEPLGGTKLAAGEAFVLKCGDGAGVNPTITLPNPMSINK